MEDLYRGDGEAYLDPLLYPSVGHGVVMAVDLDGVVEVYARATPFGEPIARGWQWRQGRCVPRLKQGAP
jgi:hypothetical protein